MSAQPTTGSSRSTAPATTTTTNRSSSPACPSAPAKTPSTPPAVSTSTTPPPGPDPRRTYGRDQLVSATALAAIAALAAATAALAAATALSRETLGSVCRGFETEVGRGQRADSGKCGGQDSNNRRRRSCRCTRHLDDSPDRSHS